MITNILVPTDGSDHANKALELAVDIAAKYQAKLVILHVLLHHVSAFDLKVLCERLNADAGLIAGLDEIADASLEAASTGFGGPVPVPVPSELLEKVAELVCADAVRRVESAGLAKPEALTVDGSAADCILAAADSQKADMIVMGSRGLGKIADLLMGSVSHKVSHLCSCTCVTVK